MKTRVLIALMVLMAGLLRGSVGAQGLPYEKEIKTFLKMQSLNPLPSGAIIFAGSSSFTMWNNVQDDFPGRTIINRAFGGSTLNDQIRYAKDILIPLSPVQIVIYCGENDLAYDENLTPTQLTERFKTLFYILRDHLPETRLTYVSMKPSPDRWHLAQRFEDANSRIEAFIVTQQNASFISIWDEMLDSKAYPDSSMFLDDMLHMNEKGYRLWQIKLENELQ